MTLQALRNQAGDRDLFRILRAWAQRKAGGNGTTGQFIALAERVSGEQLDQLFETWLFTATKPALPAATATGKLRAPPAAASLLQRLPTAALGLRRS
jgi:aminopeptidase N